MPALLTSPCYDAGRVLARERVCYGLIDPEHPQLRYIGATTRTVGARLKEHLRKCRGGSSPTQMWLQGLLDRGLQPIVVTFPPAEHGDPFRQERELLELFQPVLNLTNATSGGQGSVGFRHSDEARARMSELHSTRKRAPHSVETRRKIAEGNKRRVWTDESRRKVSESLKARHREGTS